MTIKEIETFDKFLDTVENDELGKAWLFMPKSFQDMVHVCVKAEAFEYISKDWKGSTKADAQELLAKLATFYLDRLEFAPLDRK
jgi:hypothetical protein